MPGPKPIPEPQRFWSKVDRAGECWVWLGATDKGYGKFRVGSLTNSTRRVVSAHRWSWEQVNGPVPEHLELDHLCRNPNCVNPGHLEAVPHRTNIRRSDAPMGVHARKTECVNGHPFTPENTYVYPDSGWRKCRACSRANDRPRAQRTISA